MFSHGLPHELYSKKKLIGLFRSRSLAHRIFTNCVQKFGEKHLRTS